jgi:hypothetical protein
MDSTGEERCSSQEDFDDGCKLVPRTARRSTARLARRRPHLRSQAHGRKEIVEPMAWGTGQPVMVILESPLGRSSDARAKSEASLRRHTFVR